ncbi:MAG: hypothetical protein ABEI99_06355 [Halobaculum sp.]
MIDHDSDRDSRDSNADDPRRNSDQNHTDDRDSRHANADDCRRNSDQHRTDDHDSDRDSRHSDRFDFCRNDATQRATPYRRHPQHRQRRLTTRSKDDPRRRTIGDVMSMDKRRLGIGWEIQRLH